MLGKLKVVSMLESMPNAGQGQGAPPHARPRHQRESAAARAGSEPAAAAARALRTRTLTAVTTPLGVLLVIAGPSGTGKGTVVRRLLEREPGLWYSVSATDRRAAPEEVDGRDYRFVTHDEFCRLRDDGGFLEWFEVYGDLKGTPRAPVEEHLAAGDDVVLEVDVQGALAVRGRAPRRRSSSSSGRRRARCSAPACASGPRPRPRCRARRVDEEELERRLAGAAAEEAAAADFDAVVVNDDLDRTVDELAALLALVAAPAATRRARVLSEGPLLSWAFAPLPSVPGA